MNLTVIGVSVLALQLHTIFVKLSSGSLCLYTVHAVKLYLHFNPTKKNMCATILLVLCCGSKSKCLIIIKVIGN